MTRNSGAKILCRDVQTNLRAGEQSMTERLADLHEVDPGTHQVRCKGVSQAMR